MYEINMDKLHEYYSLKEYRENGVCEGYYIVDKQGDIVPDADGASPKMACGYLLRKSGRAGKFSGSSLLCSTTHHRHHTA